MPLKQFEIPTRKNYPKLYDDNKKDQILDGVSMSNMIGFIEQFRSVSHFSQSVFNQFKNDSELLQKRIEKIQNRIYQTQNQLPNIENFLENGEFLAELHSNPWKARQIPKGNLFTPETRPKEIEERRRRARETPNLSEFDEYRDDNGSCLHDYSYPGFFRELWLKQELARQKKALEKQEVRRKKKKRSKKTKEKKRKKVEAIETKVYLADGTFIIQKDDKPVDKTPKSVEPQPVQPIQMTSSYRIQAPEVVLTQEQKDEIHKADTEKKGANILKTQDIKKPPQFTPKIDQKMDTKVIVEKEEIEISQLEKNDRQPSLAFPPPPVPISIQQQEQPPEKTQLPPSLPPLQQQQQQKQPLQQHPPLEHPPPEPKLEETHFPPSKIAPIPLLKQLSTKTEFLSDQKQPIEINHKEQVTQPPPLISEQTQHPPSLPKASGLMTQLRQQKTLNSDLDNENGENNSVNTASRGDLLASIRKGQNLRKVTIQEQQKPQSDDLTASIFDILTRRQAIIGSGSEESESSDGEWSD